jgi:hypothetical protein
MCEEKAMPGMDSPMDFIIPNMKNDKAEPGRMNKRVESHPDWNSARKRSLPYPVPNIRQ